MNSKFVKFILISCLIGKLLWAREETNSLIILKSDDLKLAKETIKVLEKEGCDIRVITLPVMRGYVPKNKLNSLKTINNVKDIIFDVVDEQAFKEKNELYLSIKAWNLFINEKKKPKTIPPNVKPILDDCKLAPPPEFNKEPIKTTAMPYKAPYNAGFYDTSEYMLGDIGVAVIMPESEGERSTEDWTFDEEAVL